MDPDTHVDLPEDLQEPFDSAKKILDTNQHRIVDDIYPWWKTFRKPIVFMVFKDIILCLAIIFLANSVRTLLDDRNEANDLEECYQAFTNASTEAIAGVRAAATRVDNAGWSALVNSANDSPVTQQVIDNVEDLIDDSEVALTIDILRIQQRENWVNEGRPMPNGECPLPGTPPGGRR